MFDRIDAAMYYPPKGRAYFFRGSKYTVHEPDVGPVGKRLRVIGDDGWEGMPEEFQAGLDAAMWYPPRYCAYFFKGSSYVRWRPGVGPKPADGNPIRTIGVTGWKELPDEFRSDLDAVFWYEPADSVCFVKGDSFVRYAPDVGVVELNGSPIRRLGVDGFRGDEERPGLAEIGFDSGLDAVFEFSNDKVYFFKGRHYARWTPGRGVDRTYPRTRGYLVPKASGWPGTSPLLAAPLVSLCEPAGDREFAELVCAVWLSSSTFEGSIAFVVNGQPVNAVQRGSVGLSATADDVFAESRILHFDLPEVRLRDDNELNHLSVTVGTEVAADIRFRRPALDGELTRLKIAIGSCSKFQGQKDEPIAVLGHIADSQPNLLLLTGDTSYYDNDECYSTPKMLRRLIAARNHPDFVRVAESSLVVATWDDHDFGPNNWRGGDYPLLGVYGGIGWVGRDESTKLFRAMWPGEFTTFGDDEPDGLGGVARILRGRAVDLFITDGRYFKKKRGTNRIWGDQQTDAIIAWLTTSRASLKILVCSTTFLRQVGNDEGHAKEAPAELRRVLEVAGTSTMTGHLLVVSGDVHFSGIRMIERSRRPAVVEFTSSPILHGPQHQEFEDWQPDDPGGGQGVSFKQYEKNAFGLLTIDVEGGDVKRVRMDAIDSAGQKVNYFGRTWDLERNRVEV